MSLPLRPHNDIPEPGAEFGTATTGALHATADEEAQALGFPDSAAAGAHADWLNAQSKPVTLTFASESEMQRAVACVNACADIDSDDLRHISVRGLQARCMDLGRANVHLTAALSDARDERDAASSKCVGLQFELGKAEATVKALQAALGECHTMIINIVQLSGANSYDGIEALMRKLEVL